jgi:hypothetical protein
LDVPELAAHPVPDNCATDLFGGDDAELGAAQRTFDRAAGGWRLRSEHAED